MTNLPAIWDSYLNQNYKASFQASVTELVQASGIDLLHIAGLSFVRMGRPDEGMALLTAAAVFRPQSSHIYTNAAFIAEQHGRNDDVEFFVNAGLVDFPEDTDLLLLKGNSYSRNLNFDDAGNLYRKILSIDPNHVQSLINLGNIARAKDRFDEAEALFVRAAAIEPDFRDLSFARATMYTQMGENDRAIEILEPIKDDVDAKFLLSLLYLSKGNYEDGFALHRIRGQSSWYRQGKFVHPLRPFDHWLEANDKDIAVIQEGGLGDMIQFVRYIPRLAGVAKSVTMFVAPTLVRLFKHNLPPHVIVRSDSPSKDDVFDYITTDVEMPYHFRTVLETIPDQIPYLSVPGGVTLDSSAKKIGICWAGGSRDGLNQRSYDERRSISLETLEPIIQFARQQGIELASLQKDVPVDSRFKWYVDPACDMMDTARLISQLDLVISVDTSVAHLAAAMGKPTWLLSRYDSCWRWLCNRSDSPWYPGVMRVFGQQQYRDWSHPIQEILEALSSCC